MTAAFGVNVGFTGTRWEMSEAQKTAVYALLDELRGLGCDLSVHHGDCVGADADFHIIARSLGAYTVGHPPDNAKLRAYCTFDMTMPPLPYMKRNKNIVRSALLMIATPLEMTKHERGGTWGTRTMAINMNRPIATVLRDVRSSIGGATSLSISPRSCSPGSTNETPARHPPT